MKTRNGLIAVAGLVAALSASPGMAHAGDSAIVIGIGSALSGHSIAHSAYRGHHAPAYSHHYGQQRHWTPAHRYGVERDHYWGHQRWQDRHHRHHRRHHRGHH